MSLVPVQVQHIQIRLHRPRVPGHLHLHLHVCKASGKCQERGKILPGNIRNSPFFLLFRGGTRCLLPLDFFSVLWMHSHVGFHLIHLFMLLFAGNKPLFFGLRDNRKKLLFLASCCRQEQTKPLNLPFFPSHKLLLSRLDFSIHPDPQIKFLCLGSRREKNPRGAFPGSAPTA